MMRRSVEQLTASSCACVVPAVAKSSWTILPATPAIRVTVVIVLDSRLERSSGQLGAG